MIGQMDRRLVFGIGPTWADDVNNPAPDYDQQMAARLVAAHCQSTRMAAGTLAAILLPLLFSIALVAAWAAIFLAEPVQQARAEEPTGGWSQVLVEGLGPLYSVFAVGEEEAWAVGAGGQIWHYSLGAWRREPSPTTVYLGGVFMLGPDEGWAVGWRTYVVGDKVQKWSDIIHYRDGAWRREAQFPDLALEGLYFTSREEGWISGWNLHGNVMLHYLAGTWQLIPVGDGAGRISMLNSREGWSVGHGILHYLDGKWEVEVTAQQLWSDPYSPCGEAFLPKLASVYAVSPEDVWAVGGCGGWPKYPDRSIMYHRTAAGWQGVPLPTRWNVNDDQQLGLLSMPGGKEGWAVSKRGGFLRYSGGQWMLPSSYLANYRADWLRGGLASMSMASPGRGWIVGQQDYETGLIIRYDPVQGIVLAPARSSAILAPGQTADFGLTVQGIGGFASPVTLSASGLPTGTVAAFSSNPVTPTAALTLTLTTATDTPSGTYPLAVTASSQDITNTRAITLVVASPLHQRFLPWVVGGGRAGGW